MPKRRKRKASACLGSGQTEGPACKLARLAQPQTVQEDTTQGVTSKFPWGSLPVDLQKSIMSNLTVRETARLTWAIKSRDARAIHADIMHKRHEALRDILRERFGEEAAVLMPALDMANPGDVYITPPIPPLLQLRPHRKGYRRGTVAMLARWVLPGDKLYGSLGRFQGYFTRAGLEGWGRWDCRAEQESFVGEWRAGKRHWGKWTEGDLSIDTAYTIGGYKNDRQHGPTFRWYSWGFSQHVVYDNGQQVK